MRCAPLDSVTTRGVLAALEPAQQQARERVVAEVVGAELQLEALGRAAPRRGHHARVVDEQVDALGHALGERAHGVEAGQVELLHAQRGVP